jgi:hypothetical protein
MAHSLPLSHPSSTNWAHHYSTLNEVTGHVVTVSPMSFGGNNNGEEVGVVGRSDIGGNS